MAVQDDRERLNIATLYVALALLTYLVYRVFEGFLVPLAWAGVIVVVCYPWHQRLLKRWSPTRAAAFSTVAVTLILVVPMAFVATAFVREGIEAVQRVQGALTQGDVPWIERAWAWVQQKVPNSANLDLASLTQQGAQRVASFLAGSLSAMLRNVALLLFDLFVMLFATFYFFRDADSIIQGVRRLLPFAEEHKDQLIRQAQDLINASVTSSLIVAAMQGFLGGVMFAALGLGAPVFWGVMMGFFSLLPLVGAWIVWAPAAVWLTLQGQMVRGVILVAVGAGLVGTVDNFLRPVLIGNRTRLSGLLIFISVLGGVGVFGMLGVILGPIVVATAASVAELYTHPPRAATVTAQAPGEETIRRAKSAVLE